MILSEKGLNFIESVEGLRLDAYLDSAGVATIGFGHTGDVKLGDRCTEEQAESWLQEDAKTAETVINKLVKVPLSQNQFDSLVSFVFNIGVGNFTRSTLLRLLNEGKYGDAAHEMGRWVYAGGKMSIGLLNRRGKEMKIFKGEDNDGL